MASRRKRSATSGGETASRLITPVTEINEKESPKSDFGDDGDHLSPMITPTRRSSRQKSNNDQRNCNVLTPGPRRILFGDTRSPKRFIPAQRSNSHFGRFSTSSTTVATAVTPSPKLQTTNKKKRKVLTTERDEEQNLVTATPKKQPSAKRRLLFGRYVNLLECAPNVEAVYKIVRKLTGNIGGNGYSGPIYGELTMHSMQKMINLMVETTGLSSESRFIDVGSGIGKPNLHVAQSPGVAFSCGVEIQHTRWALGMTCLNACLDAAVQQRLDNDEPTNHIQGNTMFLHRDITEANTFDPFTHVYMFSIGFPPALCFKLSEQWNNSNPHVCHYLICYQGPKDIIECYEFDVDFVAQTTTSMHGSNETHMGYIYRRTSCRGTASVSPRRKRTTPRIACDPLFETSFKLVQDGLRPLQRAVNRQLNDLTEGNSRMTRSGHRQRQTRY
jgi:hypothetical protein